MEIPADDVVNVSSVTRHSGSHEAHLRRAMDGFRTPPTCELDRWRGALVVALCAGNLDQAQEIVRDACELLPAVEVLDEVLAPSMHHIGSLWEYNRITIADEHAATLVCQRLLDALAPVLQIAPPRSRERILFTTPSFEEHTTGLMMAKGVLYGAGYDTVMLTKGLSHEDLCMELRRYEPSIVAFSVTMASPWEVGAMSMMIEETLPGVQMITGGAYAAGIPSSVPAHHIPRLDNLVGTVEELLAGQSV